MAESTQPLIPLLRNDEVEPDIQRIFQLAEEHNYQDPNVMRVLAHEPALMRHLLAFSKYVLYEGEVEHRLIELVRLKLAQLNACQY